MEEENAAFELNSAIKLIEKQLPSIRGKNAKGVRNTLLQRLMRQGYHRNTIEDAMALVTIESDESEEMRMLQKDYEKYKSKLIKKYDGSEFRQRLFHALARKGYSYEMVRQLMEEGESEDGK